MIKQTPSIKGNTQDLTHWCIPSCNAWYSNRWYRISCWMYRFLIESVWKCTGERWLVPVKSVELSNVEPVGSLLIWVTGIRFTLLVMCGGIEKTSLFILFLSTQQWWLPGEYIWSHRITKCYTITDGIERSSGVSYKWFCRITVLHNNWWCRKFLWSIICMI